MPYNAQSTQTYKLTSFRSQIERRLKASTENEYQIREVAYLVGELTCDPASAEYSGIISITDPEFYVGNTQTGEPISIPFPGEWKADSYEVQITADTRGARADVILAIRQETAWADEA